MRKQDEGLEQGRNRAETMPRDAIASRTRSASLLVMALFLLQSVSMAQPGAAPTYPKGTPTVAYVADELLVKFQGGPASLQAATAHTQVGAKVLRNSRFTGWQHVKLPKGLTVAQGLARYKKMAGVVAVEPNYTNRQLFLTPNDPQYGSLYGMTKISAPTAWETTTGSSNVVVAVFDTGVFYTHQDLSANMWNNPGETPGDGIDNDGNGYVDDIHGIDVYSNDSDPLDGNDHGSHVSGTIGGVGNNGLGVAGVNWTVRIMALEIFSAGGLYAGDAKVIEAFDYIIAKKNQGVNVR
ncbi:MAG TPA: S8 family serine peptidase, partial [Abditibacteriaceae bacterium]|nr:S8 family serine peptidase [Abditibacteriaceae bacterium]